MPSGTFIYNIDPVTGDLNIKLTSSRRRMTTVTVPTPSAGRKVTFSRPGPKRQGRLPTAQSSGVVKLDIQIDYLSANPGTPSGYASLGRSAVTARLSRAPSPPTILLGHVTGQEPEQSRVLVGGVQTSATKTGTNGADLLVDSPPTLDTSYNYTLKTPNPWTNGWDFNDSYFVTIKKAKLDSLGFNAATGRWSAT